MTERERLIELIKNGFFTKPVYEALCTNKRKASEYLADFLLKNGVIVLPVKVGDVVYIVCNVDNNTVIEEAAVEEVSTYRIWTDEVYYDLDDIGKTVFLTREAAEKALAERGEKLD